MLIKQWNLLPQIWKSIAFKTWLLFVEHNFPLRVYLWDDSYGIDFLLCKALEIETADPVQDLIHMNYIIEDRMKEITIDTLDSIFSMQFLPITSEITYLSPLQYFPNIKFLDFHSQNKSKVTDFMVLSNREEIYVLDYDDYMIIDFDKHSNIRDFDNIKYIKGYGWISKEMNKILSTLNLYNV